MLKKLSAVAAATSLFFTPLPAEAHSFRTTVTYYADMFVGRKMANGARFHQSLMIAAHPSLKFGTKLKINHGKKSVIVVVSDRCRCSLDLSKSAFKRLAPLSKGRVPVVVKRLN